MASLFDSSLAVRLNRKIHLRFVISLEISKSMVNTSILGFIGTNEINHLDTYVSPNLTHSWSDSLRSSLLTNDQ